MRFPVESKPLALNMLPRRPAHDDGTGTWITSPFGMRDLDGDGVAEDFHPGMDLHAPTDTLVLAPFDGVASFGSSEAGGNVVSIRHESGWVTNLDHLSVILVGQGVRVRAGDAVALSGATGRVTGPHLHVELRPPPSASGERSHLVDPAPFFFGGSGGGAIVAFLLALFVGARALGG